MSQRQRGLTLIEMLVVIVISSLLATVMMQGFTYTLSFYQRVIVKQRVTYQTTLVENWFRLTLANLAAARENDPLFDGQSQKITALTFNPLIGYEGSKTQIEWILEPAAPRGVLLRYKQGDQVYDVAEFSAGQPYFEFQDSEQKWHDTWPIVYEQTEHLPEAIRLVANDSLIFVNILGRKSAEVFIDEVMFGRE